MQRVSIWTRWLWMVGIVWVVGACSSESDEGSEKAGKTISGVVTDLDQQPLDGVHVSAYGASATTNANGAFTVSAAGAPADRLVIDFQKEGYFDQTIGKKPSVNGSTNVKVALLAKELAGSVDNASGGGVSTGYMNGTFSPNSFVRGDGTNLDGNVNVYAAYVNPDASAFGNAMPGGDFSAQDAGGDDGILTSFGALAIEAEEEATGEPALLRQDADICLAIPGSMLSSAPDTMPVWLLSNFGVWEEVGVAQRFGSEYCFYLTTLGRVNCDIFARTATLSGRVCDGGTPIPDTELRISQLSTQTDDEGAYSLLVQSSVELNLQTDFGSALTGPLEPGSTNIQDVGVCGGSGVSPSCQEMVDVGYPSTGSACGDACVDDYIQCLIAGDCINVNACVDQVATCASACG